MKLYIQGICRSDGNDIAFETWSCRGNKISHQEKKVINRHVVLLIYKRARIAAAICSAAEERQRVISDWSS